jgi:hypothetical protein
MLPLYWLERVMVDLMATLCEWLDVTETVARNAVDDRVPRGRRRDG